MSDPGHVLLEPDELVPAKVNADCWHLAEHRDHWRLVRYLFGARLRWVCPTCHPGDVR
ncbi:MAG: hypothetical protein ACXVHB_25800 [Solirubrobacteraceae bacterium]